MSLELKIAELGVQLYEALGESSTGLILVVREPTGCSMHQLKRIGNNYKPTCKCIDTAERLEAPCELENVRRSRAALERLKDPAERERYAAEVERWLKNRR